MGAELIETQTVRGRGPEREAGFYQTTWGPGTGSCEQWRSLTHSLLTLLSDYAPGTV